ncbi:MAG: RNase J family beta-CASP ribonuclease [Clostridia bacterium]|nr:RNase J family beta-CASP ribonuclease [Clostridia bacterium]
MPKKKTEQGTVQQSQKTQQRAAKKSKKAPADPIKQQAKQSRQTKQTAQQTPKQQKQVRPPKTEKTTATRRGGASRSRNGSAKKYRNDASRTETPLRIAFLGGLNEVGKNMTLYEYDGDMMLVDCGLSFPDPEMPGVDLVIPDFTYVEQNKDRIKGIVITHGHEDHIGGLAYLLKTVNIPVYGTRLTVGLIQGKLREHGLLGGAKLHEVAPGDVVTLGKFTVEMIHVNHSIPDAIALAIKTPGGTIVQTGDFKIDSTPIDGGMIDLARFAALGSEGVLCLLSDSTNAERPGYTESERKVGESFEVLFRKAGRNRIIVATFASNIHRVQQIINVAHSLGRKVAIIGRSLENVVNISAQLGYLNIPDQVLINADLINKYPSDRLVIITTGSQGEPMSALTRMAFSDHRKVEIRPNDYVIISATPIPGNEKTVGNVVNELLKLGAQVIYEKMYDVHVSGHACQEELKMILGLVKPQFFIPVHGEQKHLCKHAGLAESMGIPKENILIADNGVLVELTPAGIRRGASVPAGKVFVDGYGVGDVGSAVLRDRKHLGQDGIMIVTASLDYETGQLIAGPEVVSRGFVYVKEAEELIAQARKVAEKTLENCYYGNITDMNAIKGKVRDAISRFVYEQTKRSPMILPIIMEV